MISRIVLLTMWLLFDPSIFHRFKTGLFPFYCSNASKETDGNPLEASDGDKQVELISRLMFQAPRFFVALCVPASCFFGVLYVPSPFLSWLVFQASVFWCALCSKPLFGVLYVPSPFLRLTLCVQVKHLLHWHVLKPLFCHNLTIKCHLSTRA